MFKEGQQLGFGGEFSASQPKSNQPINETGVSQNLPDISKNQLGLGGPFIKTLDDIKPSSLKETPKDSKTEELLKKVSEFKFVRGGALKAYSTRNGFVRLTYLNDSLLEGIDATIGHRRKKLYFARTPVVIRKVTSSRDFTFTVNPGSRVFMPPRLGKTPKKDIPTMIKKLAATAN